MNEARAPATLLRTTLPTIEATEGFAARFAPRLAAGDIVALRGDLGVGKTTVARAILRALGIREPVPSPTFTLVQIYRVRDLEIWHCDLYRLERPEDALELGLEDAFAGVLTLIEWPERLGSILPNRRLELRLEFAGSGGARHLVLSGGGQWPQRLEGIFDGEPDRG